MIRVLLAEDHAIVRAGIAQLIDGTSDLVVVAQACDGLEAVDLARATEPDLIVMDLSMPNLGGAGATRQILKERSDTKILVLSSFSDRENILDAMDAGAIGYVLKDSEPDELLKAIRSAARGEVPLDPRAARVIIDRREKSRPATELTEREEEVIGLIAAGLPNKLIARRLGISEKTVKTHLTSIFKTIGVTDRTQAALWAERMGIKKPSL